ncbi:pectinesterase family protein [Cellulomonas endophytica]|uniref:pectinesterase family protein n=1 Tax=Cellulomonas endophytica TaxID=2494735 RepID=UPI0013E978FA|nr:pectinesterase family protein [Cellulomonas endophytica]
MALLLAPVVLLTTLALGATPAAAASAPSTPSSVTAVWMGHVGTVLSWSKVGSSGLTGYGVHRLPTATAVPSAATRVATLGKGTTSWTDGSTATAPAGSKVYYAVDALAGALVSKPSSTRTVTTTDRTAPAAPSSLAAKAGAAGVVLTWKAGTEADLAGFSVQSATSSSGPWGAARTVPAGTAPTFTDTAAAPGVRTYYRVTAVDRTGNTSGAATANATRPADGSIPTPSGVRAALSSDKASVVVSWTANAGTTTKGYLVERATSATGPFAVVTGAAVTGTSWTDTAPPLAATSSYRVTAVDAAGRSSGASAVVSVAVPADTAAPNAPTSPVVKVVAGVAQVTFKASTSTDTASYRVQKRVGDKDGTRTYQDWLTLPAGTVTFTDPAATEGTVGYYRVVAVDRAGNASSYLAVTANNPMVKPGTPAGLRATAGGTVQGVRLAWTANKDADLAGYVVYRSASSGGTYVRLTTVTAAAAGTAPSFTDTSAATGVAQYYRVQAVDLVGNVSAQSGAVSGTSTTAPVPLPVTYTLLFVAPDGANGAFPTISAALATIPSTNLTPTKITIAPGTYRESFRVDQPNVVLAGATGDPSDVVITDDRASGTPVPGGSTDADTGLPKTYGTAGSATVTVTAADVTLQDLTVANAFDEAAHPEISSKQAVALSVTGDRFVGAHVRLLGNQDTLLADTVRTTARSRQYYVDSYVEGDVDYVFGGATAVFERTTFRSLDRGSRSNNGYITAASTNSGSKYGFLITGSRVVSDAAAGTVSLGRPWHPDGDPAALGSVVVRDTVLPAAVRATPWTDMTTAGTLFSWRDARFSEYRNSGPGALAGPATADRPQLTDSAAANATVARYLAGSDGWAPVVVTPDTAPDAPTGLTLTGGFEQVALTWTGVGDTDLAGYRVYRAAGTAVAATPQALVSGTAPLLGTSFTDTTALDGVTYSYLVTAVDFTGHETAGAPATGTTDPARADLTVAADGSGDFTTIAAAVASIPAGRTARTVVFVEPGTYAEHLTIAHSDVVLVGTTGRAQDVVITGSRAAGTPTGGLNPDGTPATYGTSGSATVLVSGDDVEVRDLTIENTYREGTYANGQAVALRTTGDRLVFDGVRLLGNQDTLYANSPSAATRSRVYFHDCWVAGDVDFLFGRATAVLDGCTLEVLDHGTTPNGSVTAASTQKAQAYGFLITGSRIIGSAPDGSQNLGRPWQPGLKQDDDTSVADANALGHVVVRDSWLGPVVSTTATWTNMTNSGTVTDWRSARFAEYRNSGPGAAAGGERPQLSDADATRLTARDFLAGTDGWDPVAPAAADVAPAAVTGLAVSGDDARAILTWEDAPEVDVVAYRVYRAAGASSLEVPVDEHNLVGTVEKAAFTDTGLTNGTSYAYVVVAVDAAGHVARASGAVTVVPGAKPLVPDVVVAADGSGDATSLVAALAAAPAGTASDPTVVLVRPGTYREVVQVSKPWTTIVGATGRAEDVVLTFDNANGTPRSATTCPAVATATCGTGGSASVWVSASNVRVQDLTISNTFDADAHPGVSPQAVALRATGDRQVYDGVRVLGHQDTLLADAAGSVTGAYVRQYFVRSYVEGDIDFVFGRATAVFDRTTIHALAHRGGTVFAPSTASQNPRGYLVVDSRLVSDNEPGTYHLGRPWRGWADGSQGDDSRGATTIVRTWLGDGLATAQPWIDFTGGLAWTAGRFAEHGNTGPGATVNANRPQLTDAQGAAATARSWLAGTDGWDPVLPVAADSAPAAPTGVSGGTGDGTASLVWAESPQADVVGYRVYRATGAGATVPVDAEHRVSTATLTRQGFAQAGLTNGTTYTYVVTALDAAGQESPASAAVTVTPALHVDATVAADGAGDHTTLQAAIDAVPAGAAAPRVIAVEPGTYVGTTTVPAGKLVTVVGATGDPADVVLTNGTATPTLTVAASGFTASGLTLENTATSGAAPALSMTGDKVVVHDAVLRARNRTVFADTPTYTASARQVLDHVELAGNADLVLGRATLVISSSTITVGAANGSVLTPSTAADQKGFLLVASTVTTAPGVSGASLGRPYRAWADTYTPRSVGQAVVRETTIGAGVRAAAPWGTGPAGEPWTLGRFAEFATTGAGAAVNDNRPQLSPAESLGATVTAWLGEGTWYPAVPTPATPADVVAPATPTGVAASGTGGTLTLTWDAGAEPDLAGYRLHRVTGAGAGVPLTAATRVGTPAVPRFTDTGLVDGTAYTYAVVAVDAAGNASAPATVTATPADRVAPAAPADLRATGASGRVTVAWAVSPEPDLAGYRVYRAGGSTPLVADLVTATSWTELGLVDGTAYEYEVTAVDVFGNESARSAAAGATPVAGDAEAPAAPNALRAVLGRAAVALTWAPVPDVDVTGYDVWRSGPDGAWTRRTPSSVTGTAFTDTGVVVGTTYRYVVTAVDGSGNTSDRSAAVAATPVAVDLVVAADGTGDFRTVQAAIDSLPNNTSFPAPGRTILVQPGTYTGTVSAALAADGVTKGNRYGVNLVGATGDPRDVVLTASGTGQAGTVTIAGDRWTLTDLTVANTNATGTGTYQVALSVTGGDKHVFTDVRFLGDYRTLNLSTANTTTYSRSYFRDVYVEGGSDMVFGRAVAVFDRSTFHVLARGGAAVFGSTVGAGSPYGFLLTDSTVLTDGAPGSVHLSRPYNVTSSQVVVRDTQLAAGISATQPWKDWSATLTWDQARFAEYRNTGAAAAGTDVSKRPQLGDLDSYRYSRWTYLAGADGWNPIGEAAPVVPTDTTAPAAVTGLVATPGAGTVTLDWADGTEADLASYTVERSTTGAAPWARLATPAAGISVWTDTTVAVGTATTYRVAAVDAAGNASVAATATVTVSTPPATTRPVSVFVAGDSTASVYAADEAPRAGWAQALPAFTTGDVRVVDYAQSGASTKSYLAAGLLDRILREIRPGDYLLVSFGHNDEKTDDPNRGTLAWSTYQQNLQRFVDGARLKGATPVLLTPVERRQFSGGHAVPTHGEYPAAVRALAQQQGVAMIDLQALSLAAFEGLGVTGTQGWFLHLAAGASPNYPNGVTDNTHFGARGALELARIVATALRDQAVLPVGGEYLQRLSDTTIDPLTAVVWPASRPV